MAEPRRFSSGQRVALFLAADGNCTECGSPLDPGWHADHVTPWSAGGPTDMTNGQALCPPCNLKKGSSVSELRDWQQKATAKFYAKGSKDFLVSATPGAGKTRFALNIARRLLDSGAVERVAVVAPTDALRQQWADQAAEVGLDLMPVSDPTDYEKPGYHGCVLTYAQVAIGAGADLLRRSTRAKTLAILDEIHHAGESRSWGDGLTFALERAEYRLALTGTPWRRDKTEPIPFVEYDAVGKVVVDYAYEYGTAVADGVCRGVVFDAYQGEGKWTDCGKVVSAALGADLDDDSLAPLLQAVYDPTNEWMPALLAEANEALSEVREESADAGGLVIADSQFHARAYATILTKVSGEAPAVVVSDDPEAKTVIERYKAERRRWIVAVRMVSEGVDIPRLAVGVYASRSKTPLFFRQVVGRFVRTRPGEAINARVFIPAVPQLMAHAFEIEEELRHQLDIETERDEKARAEAAAEQRTFELREPISATPATLDRSIFAGDEVSPDERATAEDICRRQGIPTQYAVNMARALRERSVPVAEVTVTAAPPVEPRHRRERVLRAEVETLARKVARHTGVEFREVNASLRRTFGPRGRLTVEQLEAQQEYLARRLAE